MSVERERALGSGVEHVLNYLKRRQLENPAFFYALKDDFGIIFWADPTCRLNYSYFGDTLVFDTTCRYRRRGKRYQVPFAAFTGLNHHCQPLLFGCALILDESESSFVWLFQTWLQAMSAPPPSSITVEPDRLLQVAVSHVFCHTRLRFSQHLIFSETEDKLAHVFQSHPTFESEFVNCITEAETPAEFDASWDSLLRRYYLEDNEWLQSIYNARQQWVPIFIRDTFFGELSANEVGSCILNSFFQGFVDASTTMQMLINQYEKAIDSWREKELKADYEATNSTTSSPLEKHAASLYTRPAFSKFQEEFVETLANRIVIDMETPTTYRVAKFGEVHRGHTVNYDTHEVKANCSCQMFEYSGIVCRHILAVFRAKNVLTLPSRYLLRRWTKEARSRGNEEFSESLTVSYEKLREEATKYVEEGAKSIQSYKAAMDALDEAAKKVGAASNKTPPGNGGAQGRGEKERKIIELRAELERTTERCKAYRGNLMSILKEMDEHKSELSSKVANTRLCFNE